MRKLFIKCCWFVGLSIPIVLFLNKFIFQIDGNLPGDWDYFAQLYEAARRSILEFHQFPWWNPWVAGGVPLYANPQFGLISIHMPFVLIFGTLAGLHISIFFYFLIGFWGMYILLKHLGSDNIIAVLLSYIWIFSSFPVWHLAGGHLTFGSYFLAPWFFYFLLNIHKNKGWLWLGLLAAFLINQSIHYITIQLFVIGGFVAVYQIIVHHKKHKKAHLWELLRPYTLSAVVALPLIIHKLYFTLQYLHDYTRIPGVESGTPINLIIAALTFRGPQAFNTISIQANAYGWSEYTSYFGVITLALFAFLVIKETKDPSYEKSGFFLILAGIGLSLLLALGNFGILSPYHILKSLPIFEQMQVASRWLGWLVLGVILCLSRLSRSKVILILLILSVVDVFASNYSVINYNLGTYHPSNSSDFQQVGFYENNHRDNLNSMRFLNATESNIGDVYGYEPILGFGYYINKGYIGLSKRCAENLNTDCTFILSHNASVTHWSPNKIVLKRTGPGRIILNVNPGSYWKINGITQFSHMNVTDLKQDFVINDPSNVITLTVSP